MKLIIVFIGFLLTASVSAQHIEARDQFTCSFFHASFDNAPANFSNKSYGFNFHFYKEKPLNKGVFSLAIGAGYSWWLWDQDYSISKDFYVHPLPANRQLTQQFIEVPLEIRIRNKKREGIVTVIGFKTGFLTRQHVKSKQQDITTIRFFRDPLNQLRYGPYLKIGYGSFALESFYSINTFNQDNLSQYNPFSIGITYLYGQKLGL